MELDHDRETETITGSTYEEELSSSEFGEGSYGGSQGSEMDLDLGCMTINGEAYQDQIASLSRHFRLLIEQMTRRVQYLSENANESVLSTQRQLESNEIAQADKQMNRARQVLKQCDELEDEFLKIRQIGEIAKGFRGRIAALEKSFEKL